MKSAKTLSTSNSKLASGPELAIRKGLPNLPLSPKPKERHGAKGVRDRNEPMVLRSPPTGESVVRYALPIPSSQTRELIAEDETIRKITRHLKLVVSSLEETYGYTVEDRVNRVKPKQDDISLSVGDDMNSFLICCSQFATQLEDSVKEEYNILESLFKWFQRQVNQMEEISKDTNILEEDIPAPDKIVTSSISQIVKQMKRLDELKNSLKQQSKYSFRALLSKTKIKETPPTTVGSYESIQQQIEEFLKAPSTEELLGASITEIQTAPSLIDQLNMMLKIFKRQSDMLERTVHDQGILESKYKEIQNNFEVLSEEKSVLENELQKVAEKKNERTKKTVKSEKKKEKGKSDESEGKVSPTGHLKLNEELIQTQKKVEALQIENKALQERLKQVVQEAERSKLQLDYLLNQGTEFLKNEGKTVTTMEMNADKIKVKYENLKETPLETETKPSLISSLGGKKTNNVIQEHPQISMVQNKRPIEESSEKKTSSPAISDLSEILKSQDKSVLSKNAKEVSVDKDHTPPENHDTLFTVVISSRENQDPPSAETSPSGYEAVTSFTSPPVLTEENAKANISEEKLQRKTENQTYQEEGKFEAPYEASTEIVPLENKDLSESQTQGMKQNISEDMISTSRNHESGAENNEATGNDIFQTYDEQPDENLGHDHQDSKTEMNVKKEKTPKNEILTNNDEVPVRDLMPEHQDSEPKQEMQVKKRKASRKEKHNVHDEVPDENLTLKSQDSASNTEVEFKKQKTSRGEELDYEDVDGSFLLEDLKSSSGSIDQIQASRADQPHTLSIASELSDTAEDLSEMKPTITDLIFHLDLDKVVETDPRQLQDVFGNHLIKNELKTQPKKMPGINLEHLRNTLEQHFLKGEHLTTSKNRSGPDSDHFRNALEQYFLKGKHPAPSNNLSGPDSEHFRDTFEQYFLKGEHLTTSRNLSGPDSEHFRDTFEQYFLKGEHLPPSRNLSGPDSEHFRDTLRQYFLKGEHLTTSTNLHENNPEHWRNALGQHLFELPKDLPEPNVEHMTVKKIKKRTTKTLLKTKPVLGAGKSKTKLLTDMMSGMDLHKNKDTSTQSQEDIVNKNTPQSRFPTKVISLSPFNKKGQPKTVAVRQTSLELPDLLPFVISPDKSPGSKALKTATRKKTVPRPYFGEKKKS